MLKVHMIMVNFLHLGQRSSGFVVSLCACHPLCPVCSHISETVHEKNFSLFLSNVLHCRHSKILMKF